MITRIYDSQTFICAEAAANAYLDAFAGWRQAGPGTPR